MPRIICLSHLSTAQLAAYAERRRTNAQIDLLRAEEYEAEITRRSAAMAGEVSPADMQPEVRQDILQNRPDFHEAMTAGFRHRRLFVAGAL